jgi:hypothetical protein
MIYDHEFVHGCSREWKSMETQRDMRIFDRFESPKRLQSYVLCSGVLWYVGFGTPLLFLLYVKGVGLQGRPESVIVKFWHGLYLYLSILQHLSSILHGLWALLSEPLGRPGGPPFLLSSPISRVLMIPTLPEYVSVPSAPICTECKISDTRYKSISTECTRYIYTVPSVFT